MDSSRNTPQEVARWEWCVSKHGVVWRRWGNWKVGTDEGKLLGGSGRSQGGGGMELGGASR